MCLQFMKIGLFAVGGGMAAIPFFYEISDRFGWFTHEDIMDFIAVAESTPGPIGVNMATYAGYLTGGWYGAILVTLSLTLPSLVVILIVARILEKFRRNRFVIGSFHILRPTSTALITSAAQQIMLAVLFGSGKITFDNIGAAGSLLAGANLPAIIIFAIFFGIMFIKPLKKIHPIAFIGIAAVLGIVFRL